MDRGRRRRCASWASSITPTPCANRPTTASRTIGKLDKALDEAVRRKWTVVDMKNDWKVIYPFEMK